LRAGTRPHADLIGALLSWLGNRPLFVKLAGCGDTLGLFSSVWTTSQTAEGLLPSTPLQFQRTLLKIANTIQLIEWGCRRTVGAASNGGKRWALRPRRQGHRM